MSPTLQILKNISVILHVLTAAAYFGLGLRLAGQARAAARLARPAAQAMVEDVQRTVRLMGIFLVLTLVFALTAFFIGGGFGGYSPNFHTSLLLLLVLMGVHFLMIRPAWNGMHGVFAGEASPTDEAEGYRKRIAMSVGIAHLLWVVILVLMFWNHYPLTVG